MKTGNGTGSLQINSKDTAMLFTIFAYTYFVFSRELVNTHSFWNARKFHFMNGSFKSAFLIFAYRLMLEFTVLITRLVWERSG